jgi:hypothetical protein
VTINFVEKLIVLNSDGQVIYTEGDVTQDSSVNYGPRFQGNVTINGPIKDAFNNINNINTGSVEGQTLQALLKALHDEVTKLVAVLPDAEAEQAARNLRNLTEAATAKKLDRRWFDVSADGLINAAKAVASLTAPVTSAVKAVVGLFEQ